MSVRAVTFRHTVTLPAQAACRLAHAHDPAPGAGADASCQSPSLTVETVAGPDGVVTTRVALGADAKMGVPERTGVEVVVPGVCALRGWGIAHGFAIDAPGGWIIVDTGDSTKAAAEMRERLDEIRAFVGTPSVEQPAAATVDENLQFVGYLVDPRKAEGKRRAFTSAEGDPRVRRVELRNGVLVVTGAGTKGSTASCARCPGTDHLVIPVRPGDRCRPRRSCVRA